MKTIAVKTGKISAWITALSFFIWILAFILIAVSSPLFYWSGLEDYIQFHGESSQFPAYLAKGFMLLFALSYPVLLLSLQESLSGDRFYCRIGWAFALLFSLSTSLHYFVQISAMRFAMEAGTYEGLEHFLQANPTSFLSSVNMLGWTLMLGISSLFMWAAFRGRKKGRILKNAFLLCGISCLLAAVGYLAQYDPLTFVCINIGSGGALMAISLSSIRYFNYL